MPGHVAIRPWRSPLTFLLEREAELAALERGGCVLVRGPAGIGKSALLAEARRRATAPVYAATGSELERDFAYGAVRQLLGDVPEGSAEAVLHAAYWLVADRCPAVLIIDDAHWLDRQSLRWLAYMVNRIADLDLTIIIAARESDEMLSRIALHSETVVLEPRPLSAEAVAQLGGTPAIHEATGGNPFYVHALLAGTPGAVVESVALRLAALPEACTRLARALAVLDGGGTVAARLAGLDVRTTVTAAEALARADIVRGDGFAHPLVREAVYTAIPAAERADLHARAARLETSPERIAAQLMAAGPGADDWAVEALREAARGAWARGAPDAAARYLRRAREERPQDVAVLRELARALIASEGPDGLPVLREALALAPPTERAEIALELGRALFTQGYFADAANTFATPTQGVRPLEPGRLKGSDPLSVELATVAVLDLSLVRRFGGLDAIAARLPASPVAAWIAVARDPEGDGAARAEAALADPELQPSGAAAALVALMAAGRLEQAEAAWTEIAEAARVRGELETLRLATALRALVRVRQGRVAEAEADLRELIAWVTELQLPLASYRTALPFVIAPLLDALIERGELDEAAQWPALTGLDKQWPEEFGFTFLIDSLARLRRAQGREQESLALAREVERRQRAWGFRNPGFIPFGPPEEQLEAARAFHVPREEGMALLALGRADEAVEVLEDSPARLEYAKALAAAGHWREALELAERLGATALATTARDALIAAGARPRRAAVTGTAALTAAQRRVAALAAQGLGNREIAESLFLTEKTVEGHLGASYRKLGIASRAQLAERLARDDDDRHG